MNGMDPSRRRALRAVLLLAVAATGGSSLAGCAKVVLEPATMKVERRSIVRVTVLGVESDLLEFEVENLSTEPLVIIKSEIVIETVVGTIKHPPGTKTPVFEVAPGGKQKVLLKFSVKGMQRGDPFEVHFDRAIRQRGQPVALDSVLFYVAHAPG
jgi:hypothetical protein